MVPSNSSDAKRRILRGQLNKNAIASMARSYKAAQGLR